jgi:hypothetical protein
LVAAQQATGLQVLMTGAMGKRTKFQSFETAQLVVEARSGGPTAQSPSPSPSSSSSQSTDSVRAVSVPKELMLNDSDLLEQPSYSNLPADAKLSPLDQTILLAVWYASQRFLFLLSYFVLFFVRFGVECNRTRRSGDIAHNQAKDLMAREQMSAFLQRFSPTSYHFLLSFESAMTIDDVVECVGTEFRRTRTTGSCTRPVCCSSRASRPIPRERSSAAYFRSKYALSCCTYK